MPALERPTPYQQIDQDPHFARVVRYFRPSDYGVWAAGAGAFPALLVAFERFQPSRPASGMGSALRLGMFLGVCGGFLLAYQRSSLRFWGWTENTREADLDKKEMSAKIAAGEPMYGKTDLNEYMQGVASRNSKFSQLKFSTIPWFNTVNTGPRQHGVDPAKYGSSEEAERKAQQG